MASLSPLVPFVSAFIAAISALIAALALRYSGRKLDVRAFMFCYEGADDGKLVIQARSGGRSEGYLDIIGVEVKGWTPGGKLRTIKHRVKVESGPELPHKLRWIPDTWIADGRHICSDATYNLGRGDAPTAWVLVPRGRWKARKIRVRRTPRDFARVSDFVTWNSDGQHPFEM